MPLPSTIQGIDREDGSGVACRLCDWAALHTVSSSTLEERHEFLAKLAHEHAKTCKIPAVQ